MAKKPEKESITEPRFKFYFRLVSGMHQDKTGTYDAKDKPIVGADTDLQARFGSRFVPVDPPKPKAPSKAEDDLEDKTAGQLLELAISIGAEADETMAKPQLIELIRKTIAEEAE